jgi:plasmid stabilization system protein ParE
VDYHLIYSQKALDDLAEIVGYIAEDDPEAASRFGESLLDHIQMLTRFPKMGTISRKRRYIRKLVHSPVLVYYKISEARRNIGILYLRHAARRLPRV